MERVSLLEQEDRFRKALSVFEKFKQIESPATRRKGYDSTAYSTLEKRLQTKAAEQNNNSPAARKARAQTATVQSVPGKFMLGAFYPNSTAGVGTLPLALPEEAHVVAQVYDVMGRRVATLADGRYDAGRHELSFAGRKLPSGVYVMRARVKVPDAGTKVFTRKVTVAR